MILHRRLLRKLPPKALYGAMAWKMRLIGEPEIRLLPSLVPPDKLALDVGANYGAYTYWLSRLSRRVIAFEPLPHLSDFLRRVVPPNVEVMSYALSDRSGEAECSVPMESGMLIEGHASLRELSDQNLRRFRVRTMSLDETGIQNVGFIKIDVEGFEGAVLSGAEKLLLREHPTLLVEIEQRHMDRPIEHTFDWLKRLGYTGQFFRAGRLRPLSHFDVSRDQAIKNHTRLGTMRRAYVNNFIFSAKSQGRET